MESRNKRKVESKFSQSRSVVNADWWINIILYFLNDLQLRLAIDHLIHLPASVLSLPFTGLCGSVSLLSVSLDNLSHIVLQC